jgi:hypothetical protein
MACATAGALKASIPAITTPWIRIFASYRTFKPFRSADNGSEVTNDASVPKMTHVIVLEINFFFGM